MMVAKAAPRKVLKPKTPKKTVFKYFAPEASEVCLAGSFNEWRDKDLFLKKDKQGHWSISIPLAEGRYEYRYIIDGNWTHDQNQVECAPNPFAGWNSVIQVQA